MIVNLWRDYNSPLPKAEYERIMFSDAAWWGESHIPMTDIPKTPLCVRGDMSAKLLQVGIAVPAGFYLRTSQGVSF